MVTAAGRFYLCARSIARATTRCHMEDMTDEEILWECDIAWDEDQGAHARVAEHLARELAGMGDNVEAAKHYLVAAEGYEWASHRVRTDEYREMYRWKSVDMRVRYARAKA